MMKNKLSYKQSDSQYVKKKVILNNLKKVSLYSFVNYCENNVDDVGLKNQIVNVIIEYFKHIQK